jgi:hypothetical protein
MVVRDAFSHSWYLVVGPDEESLGSFIYKVKPLSPNQHQPAPGAGTQLIYGGYTKWIFIAKPEVPENPNEISPEEQKRIREAERKRSNERIARELRRDKQAKKASQTPRTNAGKTVGKLVPFRRKDDK